ncbi:hypothetical protein DYB28_007037, partial [Aphanomyces astaci]
MSTKAGTPYLTNSPATARRSNVVLADRMDLIESANGDTTKIGAFYSSCLDTATLSSLGLTPLADSIKSIRSANTTLDLLAVAGELVKYGVPAFVDIKARPDDANATKNALFALRAPLPLQQLHYTTPSFWNLWKGDYDKYIASVLELAGYTVEQAAAAVLVIIRFEQTLAGFALRKLEETEAEASPYTVFNYCELDQKYPLLIGSWLKANGFNVRDQCGGSNDWVGFHDLTYFDKAEVLLKNTTLDDLRTIVEYKLIHASSKYLTPEFRTANWNIFDELLGQDFIDAVWSPGTTKTTDELVKALKSSFSTGIATADWLDNSTRANEAVQILDAESRVGRMLDELMRSLEQDHQEWVLHQEGKMVVEVMTKSIKPESLKTAVQKQLQLQRNKALKSDVFRYVNWLRTFAACHQLYVGIDDESKPSPAATPVEAPRGGKPHMSRRDSGREDAAKNNGRVGGKAETIVPKNAEPSARKGCLKCGDMSHRVARCPKTAPGEAETLLAAQRQKTERGVLLENIVRVDDVLLDSGSDVTVVTRGVMDALDAAGVKVGTVSHSVPHLAYPYGSDAKPVVMTRSVKFNCVTLDTTCGPLVLRGLKAWVDDASTATELIVSRPVMELLGFSVEILLVGARKKKGEWDVSSKLNPLELDPDDAMEYANPEVYPKTSDGDEAGRFFKPFWLHDVLAKHIDVFREDLGDDPPVKVEPLK